MGKESELLQAVRNEDFATVSKILAKAKASKHKLIGTSVKKLHINGQDQEGLTILHLASQLGNGSIMRLLLDSGCLVEAKDKRGYRALHYAARLGKQEPVHILLQWGSSPNEPAHEGDTPLHVACQLGHYHAGETLLRYHADPTISNSQHRTPLHMACEFGHEKVVELLLSSKLCVSLLKGTVLDEEEKRVAPLHLASANCHTGIMRLLVSHGMDINRTSGSRGTSLHEAVRHSRLESVRCLLECGAEVDSKDKDGRTPLHLLPHVKDRRVADDMKKLLQERPVISVPPIHQEINKTSSIMHHQVIDSNGGGRCHEEALIYHHVDDEIECDTSRIHFLRGTSSSTTASTHYTIPKCVRFSGSSFDSSSTPSASSSSDYGYITCSGVGDDHTPTSSISSSSQQLPGMVMHSPRHYPVPTVNGHSTHHHPHSTGSSSASSSSTGSSSCGGESPAASTPVGATTSSGGGGLTGLVAPQCYHTPPQQAPPQSSSSTHQNKRSSDASLDSNRSYTSVFETMRIGLGGVCDVSASSSLSSLEQVGDVLVGGCNLDVSQLLANGVPDCEVVRAWLSELQLDEYYENFTQAGYDMPTISRITPEDMTAIGIARPQHRKRLKYHLARLNLNDNLPESPTSVREWLEHLGLEPYEEILLSQGYGAVSDLYSLDTDDLDDIGISKLGHQKKLMLAVRRLRDVKAGIKRQSTISTGSSGGWSAGSPATGDYLTLKGAPLPPHSPLHSSTSASLSTFHHPPSSPSPHPLLNITVAGSEQWTWPRGVAAHNMAFSSHHTTLPHNTTMDHDITPTNEVASRSHPDLVRSLSYQRPTATVSPQVVRPQVVRAPSVGGSVGVVAAGAPPGVATICKGKRFSQEDIAPLERECVEIEMGDLLEQHSNYMRITSCSPSPSGTLTSRNSRRSLSSGKLTLETKVPPPPPKRTDSTLERRKKTPSSSSASNTLTRDVSSSPYHHPTCVISGEDLPLPPPPPSPHTSSSSNHDICGSRVSVLSESVDFPPPPPPLQCEGYLRGNTPTPTNPCISNLLENNSTNNQLIKASINRVKRTESTSSVESNTMPFANENVGTIKLSRGTTLDTSTLLTTTSKTSSKNNHHINNMNNNSNIADTSKSVITSHSLVPCTGSIVSDRKRALLQSVAASSSRGGSENMGSEITGDESCQQQAVTSPSSSSNNATLDTSSTTITNTSMSEELHVLDDIDSMLADLSCELDAMLLPSNTTS